MALDEYSDTLTPLPPVLSKGLIAVAVCGSLSFISTIFLITYLTYRIVSWRLKGNTQPTNQVFILIYNLLLADIQQALAFTLNISFLQRNGIFVGTRLCWTQGWFVSIGDLASSVFIFAVAVHTWFAVVKEQKVSNTTLYCIVAGLWTFVYSMALIGPLLHPHELYVRAEAWCWINDAFEASRIWLHYFWIYIAMFGTILIYTSIFVTVRYRAATIPDPDVSKLPPSCDGALYPTSSATSAEEGRSSFHMHLSRKGTLPPQNNKPKPTAISPIMLIYPAIYTICTSPIASCRLVTMTGRQVSLGAFCMAGAMIASNGFLDVLLYSITRREIVFSAEQPDENIGLDTFAGLNLGALARGRGKWGTTTHIEGGANRADSQEELCEWEIRHAGEVVHFGIQTCTTVDVNTSKAKKGEVEEYEMRNMASSESLGKKSTASGDRRRSWEDPNYGGLPEYI